MLLRTVHLKNRAIAKDCWETEILKHTTYNTILGQVSDWHISVM